jgi:glycosyltransferase involved in cell wall biosynthesis
MNKPAISVVMPSYNHGRYVEACIEAFLGQDFQDFELIIIDDASTDDNVGRIRRYADKRINLMVRTKNCGVAAGMCEGFRLAKADLIAFFATDDLPAPGYLSSALRVMECSPGAVAAYFPLRKIDEKGEITGEVCSLPLGVGRFEVLKRSFKEGNQLPSPGMVMRRDAALSTLVPTGVSQYSDWILNNRLLLQGDIVFAPDGLVLYRVSSASLSARSDKAISREAAETRLMMDDFLSISTIAQVREIFGEDADEFAHLSDVHVPYVLGRLAIGSGYHEKRCWGYETIMRHVSQSGCAASLAESAGFTYKELMALAPVLEGSPVKEINDLRRRLKRQKRVSAILAGLFILACWYLFRGY